MKILGAALFALAALAVLPAQSRELLLGTPRNLGSPVNTPWIEVGPNLSADDLTLYFVSDRPGGRSGAPELWQSTRATPRDEWGPPTNLGTPVNSHSAASPTVSADQLELYFDTGTQVRPGGQGSGDIWVTRRKSVSDPWSEPQNLGATVNSPFADSVPKLTRDGGSLFFASSRPGGSGNRDIWVTTRRSPSEPWGAPSNLGPVVNGPASDWGPALSTDGLVLVFQSDRPGGLGGDDLWFATRATSSAPWSVPRHLDAPINTPADEAKPEFSHDDRTLLFMSRRPGGIGALDIWSAPIQLR